MLFVFDTPNCNNNFICKIYVCNIIPIYILYSTEKHITEDWIKKLSLVFCTNRVCSTSKDKYVYAMQIYIKTNNFIFTMYNIIFYST